MNHYTIIGLEATNVKRLRAIEITPNPKENTVIIGGRNGQGKSSVLDSIMYALAGKSTLPEMPIREGAASGKIAVDLGEFVVTRTLTQAGGTLVVKPKDGDAYKSPQAILDSLCGNLSFDPLAFTREKPEKQLETLRKLVGLDFTAQDKAHDDLYNQRTNVNREVTQLKARLATMPKHEGAPESQVSVSALMAELEAANKTNGENRSKRMALGADRDSFDKAERAVRATEAEIEKLHARLAQEKETRLGISKRLQESEAIVSALTDIDTAPITAKIKGAETVNAQVRANTARAEVIESLADKEKDASKLSFKIDEIKEDKAKKLAAAKFPLPELSFDDSRVLLNGKPFTQGSAAEQLRASVAIGLALNPKLRVILIRDGSLLDDDSMADIARLASEKGAQIWIERVCTEASECTLLIEDGSVKECEVVA